MRFDKPDESAFLQDFNSGLEDIIRAGSGGDELTKYLSEPAPNIIEWVTGVKYWNVPSTFGHWRQYQILRDVFMLRCPTCNSSKPEDVECWGKSRMELESEVLLTWDKSEFDFVCPKCKATQRELIKDGFFERYTEMIILAGMRSGKSYLGAHVGGYFEHMLSAFSVPGKGHLQRLLKQEQSEIFEVTFAASTGEQAQKTIYAKYRGMRGNSPWIQKYVGWVKAQAKAQSKGVVDPWKYSTNDKQIDDGRAQVRYNRIASDSAGVAGKTRIFASIDEWARLINSEGTRSAIELYSVLNNSLKTVRAAVSLNNLPAFLGMMTNVTSPIAQDDPAMLRYNMAHSGDLPSCYSWKGATWEFNPFMPRSEFNDEYLKDAVIAERDFGANPPLSATPYIEDPQRFWRCINWETEPIVRYSIEHITDPTGKSYVSAKAEDCLVDSVNNYYVFADAGKSWDAFSIAIARPKWVKSSDAVSKDDEEKSVVPPSRGRIQPGGDDRGIIQLADSPEVLQAGLSSVVATGFDHMQQGHALRGGGGVYGDMLVTEVVSAFRLVPLQGRDIWFDSLVKIIEFLKSRLRIVEFGCDTWNSTQAVQSIRDMGIPAQEITLKAPDDFVAFKNLAYNGRVRLLPPDPQDHVSLKDNGLLTMGVPQVNLQAPSVALVELLKLTRSENLKNFYNPKKGLVRGQDSDDLARCYIGVNRLVQNSVVDVQAKNNKQQRTLQRLKAMERNDAGSVFSSRG